MQGIPGPWSPQPDPGAMALRTMSDSGEIGTIATAQLLGGLSGLLVSEGLARVMRELMGGAAVPEQANPAAAGTGEEPAGAGTGGDRAALAGLSATALKELVAQGVAGRIVALNTLNTYLSLAAAEQLRRIGAQLATGGGLPPVQGAAMNEPLAVPGGTTTAPQAGPPAPFPAQAPPAGLPLPWPGPLGAPQQAPLYWFHPAPSPYRYPGRR